jgi:uncharacterized protein (TIGR02001 family)
MIDLPPPQPHFEFLLASEGMSKGLAQTEGGQALARLEVDAGGFLAGGQLKNITTPDAEAEAGLFLGYRGRLGRVEIAGTVSYKAWLWRHRPADAEAVEFNLAASRSWGRLTPRVAVSYSPDDLGTTGASLFLEAGITFRLVERLSISALAGRRERSAQPDYTAFGVGMTFSITRNFSADLRYYDSDRSALGRSYRERLVLALRARF